MDIHSIAARAHAWVESVGWHNKTDLEALALIISEIGEAANECRGEPTPLLGSELADIVLRVADLAVCRGIDLESEIAALPPIPENLSLSPLASLSLVARDIAGAVDSCCGCARETPGAERAFAASLAFGVRRLEALSERLGIDLQSECEAKMAINEARGTRGRAV